MVRSMYSGVTGMKSHQTKLDVIGNNIANVNTYGFKSSRATFRDVYYQSLRNAAAPTGNSGGTNPSGVGYGSSVASVDLLMTQSAVTNTGNPMDVAINGDGFFQVQDADGNTFYTRAGMLDIDSDGNLVDMNGYFVLGVSGSPVGQEASSNKINVLNSIGSVPPTKAGLETSMNSINYGFTATNATTEGNVSLSFIAAEDLPYGVKAEAVVGTSNIQIRLNAKETFADMGALQDAVNSAITSANNGKAHPAGNFNFSMDPNSKFVNLTGAEICGTNYGYVLGSVSTKNAASETVFGGFTVKGVGEHFTGGTGGKPTFKLEQSTGFGADWTGAEFQFTVECGGKTYKSQDPITQDMLETSGSIVLVATPGADEKDSITVTFPRMSSILDAAQKDATAVYEDTDRTNGLIPPGFNVGDRKLILDGENKISFDPATVDGDDDIVASHPSNDLGFSSSSFKLSNGTAGGSVQVKDLTGIIIGADGVITASHAILGSKEVGRIDLANFNNAAALIQNGNSYYTVSPNSGNAGLSIPGTGGTGGLKTSSLELSNVDLSTEFADMITTQRGFQANSRMITVSDTLLEELVNLKR